MLDLLDWPLSLIFLLAAGLAWVMTYGVRQVARRRNLLDHPNQYSSHTLPTPGVGGLGIVTAFLLTLLMFTWWQPAWAAGHGPELRGLLLGGVAMAGLGLWDDLRPLSPFFKLVGQVLIALIPILFGLRLHGIIWLNGQLVFGFLEIPLTLLWIVALVNLINFMDGIDGLVAGNVTIVSLFLIALAYPAEAAWLAAPLGALSGAGLGFLRFNAQPASIFMGDSGSLFLGFMLATFSIIYAPGHLTTSSLLVPLLLMSALLFDAVYTLIQRCLRQENVFKPHRQHLYQRLVILGISHRRVSEFYYSLSLIAGGSALLYVYSSSAWYKGGVIFVCLIAFAFMIWQINRLEKQRDLARLTERKKSSHPIIPGRNGSVNRLHDLQFDELLRREPVEVDE